MRGVTIALNCKNFFLCVVNGWLYLRELLVMMSSCTSSWRRSQSRTRCCRVCLSILAVSGSMTTTSGQKISRCIGVSFTRRNIEHALQSISQLHNWPYLFTLVRHKWEHKLITKDLTRHWTRAGISLQEFTSTFSSSEKSCHTSCGSQVTGGASRRGSHRIGGGGSFSGTNLSTWWREWDGRCRRAAVHATWAPCSLAPILLAQSETPEKSKHSRSPRQRTTTKFSAWNLSHGTCCPGYQCPSVRRTSWGVQCTLQWWFVCSTMGYGPTQTYQEHPNLLGTGSVLTLKELFPQHPRITLCSSCSVEEDGSPFVFNENKGKWLGFKDTSCSCSFQSVAENSKVNRYGSTTNDAK